MTALPQNEVFTLSAGSGGSERPAFSGDRRQHGNGLKAELQAATNSEPRDETPTREDPTGTYITFVSFPGFELVLKSLDSLASGTQPELIAVSTEDTEAGSVQRATVFIPEGKKSYFLKKLDQYLETTDSAKARNADLVETIASIRRATIRELWTDPPEEFPTGTERVWWEVWLSRRDGHELNRLERYAESNELTLSRDYLGFGNRTVALVRANIEELSRAMLSLDDIAELRRPHDVASFLTAQPSAEQAQWVNDLLNRLSPASLDAPAACVLDTGVQQNHPLLRDSLHTGDVHTIDSGESQRDVHGHGTEMAGLALYGDLEQALTSSLPIALRHRLESVKFLRGDFDSVDSVEKDLYGAITARAVDRPEIQAPDRRRVFSVATTSPRLPAVSDANAKVHDPGKPTAWSATIDALAAGCSVDYSNPPFTYLDSDENVDPRLFVLSAGNIRDVRPFDDHLSRSDIEPVEDPAQAWNAITVGAFTDLDDMSGAIPSFGNYMPLAPRGELAPTSRTSVVFDSAKWPVKPDVVAEGGNVARSPDGTSVDTPENLAILTTRAHNPGQGAFTTTRDTSAATAQVTAIAADVMASYPDFWPETVRALVVHSAEWTPIMRRRLEGEQLREHRSRVFRRYGMGVPDLTRALNSAADALTLVSQSVIRPFEHVAGRGNEGRAWEMNTHELPWPTEVLEGLGETQVRMRVTLSYFIQPNPSRRGWTGRYIYPSHGLRFAVRRAAESTEEFRKRINTRAREDGEKIIPSESDSKQWFFGANQQQSAGSLHTDIWSGNASELARRGVLAIYPVAGWWKHSKQRNRSEFGVRYSLVVSVETPEIDADVWTPVYQQIQASIPITT